MTHKSSDTRQNSTSSSLVVKAMPQYCQKVMRDELAILQIRHPRFHADIAYQGAQLISFIPQQSDKKADWLWLSSAAEYKKGRSIRGGIPICWPWFGDLDKNPDAVKHSMKNIDETPAHGFVRSIEWQLINHHCDDSILTMDWQPDKKQLPSIGTNGCHLKLRMTLTSASLSLALITQAGATPLTISQALHTYFPTSDIHQTNIFSPQISHFVDAVNHWQTCETNNKIEFIEETDRIYYSDTAECLTFTCKTPEQIFQINSNSSSAVVWNPWVKKSQRLSQFNAQDYQTMYCVETANVLHDCVELDANQSHELTLKISLS